jgi:hypothetical protein
MLAPISKTWRLVEGKLIHDCDCHWWSWRICTCGLIHFCLPQADKMGVLYPTLEAEWAAHQDVIEKISMLRRTGSSG